MKKTVEKGAVPTMAGYSLGYGGQLSAAATFSTLSLLTLLHPPVIHLRLDPKRDKPAYSTFRSPF